MTGAPFNLEATVRVLQRRPTNRVEIWQEDRYLRLVGTAGALALVEVENRGTIDAPDVRYGVRGSETSTSEPRIREHLRQALGLDVDPGPLQRLADVDARLRPTGLALRGMRPPRFTDLFEAFANVLPFQQLSLDAGTAIVGRLVERFGEHFDHEGVRFHGSPTAERVAQARLPSLRACGLSTRKAVALRSLARGVVSGELVQAQLERTSTEEAVKKLVGLSGIGPWTASVVMLRGFGRLDVFPPGDVGALGGLGALVGSSRVDLQACKLEYSIVSPK